MGNLFSVKFTIADFTFNKAREQKKRDLKSYRQTESLPHEDDAKKWF